MMEKNYYLDLKNKLDKKISGQEEAKKAALIAVSDILGRRNGIKTPKDVFLFHGPSGCGKTYLIETLCRLTDIPFSVINTPCVTGAGYRGEDIEQCLERLISAADGAVKKAENGILFFDEFDKLLLHANDSASPETVQAQLLRLIEGERVDLNDHGKPSSSRNKPVIDTKDITFIFAGAFSGLTRKKKSTIGFTGYEDTNVLTTEELINAGFSPELIGRIGRIIPMRSLTEEEYIDVLKNKEDSVIKKYQYLFLKQDVYLSVEPEVYEIAASLAVKKDLGVRGLYHLFIPILDDARIRCLLSPGLYTDCRITEESFLSGEAVLSDEEDVEQ